MFPAGGAGRRRMPAVIAAASAEYPARVHEGARSTAVIPAFSEGYPIGCCRDPLEIIGVNNSATDPTVTLGATRGARVPCGYRRGICAHEQAGTLAAQSSLIANLDADSDAEPGRLRRTVVRLDANPGAVAHLAAPGWARAQVGAFRVRKRLAMRLREGMAFVRAGAGATTVVAIGCRRYVDRQSATRVLPLQSTCRLVRSGKSRAEMASKGPAWGARFRAWPCPGAGGATYHPATPLSATACHRARHEATPAGLARPAVVALHAPGIRGNASGSLPSRACAGTPTCHRARAPHRPAAGSSLVGDSASSARVDTCRWLRGGFVPASAASYRSWGPTATGDCAGYLCAWSGRTSLGRERCAALSGDATTGKGRRDYTRPTRARSEGTPSRICAPGRKSGPVRPRHPPVWGGCRPLGDTG